MEPPTKRPRVGQATYDDSDEEVNDELSLTPSQFDAQQDPMYQLDKRRAKATSKLKFRFEHIFNKYEKDFEGVGDEINLHTGEVVVDHGHIQSLQDEKDREEELLTDEEERISQRKPSSSRSLVAGRSIGYNAAHMLQNGWIQPPALPGGEQRLSSLAFCPQIFGAPNPFASGAPLFRSGPEDPAWQAPEIPAPIMHSQFGSMGQSMGYMASEGFGEGSGLLSGLFGHQTRRRITSSNEFRRKSLPAFALDMEREGKNGKEGGGEEGNDDDEEEDEILLTTLQDDTHGDASAQERDNPKERHLVTLASMKTTSKAQEHVFATRKPGKDSPRRRGRSKKTRSDAESTTTGHAEQPQTILSEATMATPAPKDTSDSVSKRSPSPPSAKRKANGKQLIVAIIRKQDMLQNNSDTPKLQSRRSARSRKQTQFYGQVSWLKKQRRKEKHKFLHVSLTSANESPTSPESTRPFPNLDDATKGAFKTTDSMDIDQEQSVVSNDAPEYGGSETEMTVGKSGLLEAENAEPQHIEEAASPDHVQLGDASHVNISGAMYVAPDNKAERKGHSEVPTPADEVTGVDLSGPNLLSSTPTADEPQIKTNVAGVTEIFTRNEPDPSYAFSDDEDEYQSPDHVCMADAAYMDSLEKANSGPILLVAEKTKRSGSTKYQIGEEEDASEHGEAQTPEVFSPAEPGAFKQSPAQPNQLGSPELGATNSPDGSPSSQRSAEQLRASTIKLPLRSSTKLNRPNVSRNTTREQISDPAPQSSTPSSSLKRQSTYLPLVSPHSSRAVPQTPRKRSLPLKERESIRHLTSSTKKTAISSMAPGNSDDDDEISILSSSHMPTLSFHTRFQQAASHISPSTPRQNRKHSLLFESSTPSRQRSPGRPATESRAQQKMRKQKPASSLAYSSPLAFTPKRRKPSRGLEHLVENLVRTPGGTVRRCGEEGFSCDRDFCFTCCK
ncbi:uncharacterized protein BCR38DRAFT_125058 [Pseudomassariella vexata]|uniref:Centromere protein Scm3-domain-containing protein n=1 Tax=Pseudomassariella vexata TaxID=1141098 RepID=A0A1Y2D8E3_9PEZI|nr:uncharacterized protein BCR38DRAFT_125058 [Pseudomassariella vexata]ORY55487.1 hypothetical protein BCR38DRAFT_125058 [Pseudomassariella vexata]